jgi:hypothetical protein
MGVTKSAGELLCRDGGGATITSRSSGDVLRVVASEATSEGLGPAVESFRVLALPADFLTVKVFSPPMPINRGYNYFNKVVSATKNKRRNTTVTKRKRHNFLYMFRDPPKKIKKAELKKVINAQMTKHCNESVNMTETNETHSINAGWGKEVFKILKRCNQELKS